LQQVLRLANAPVLALDPCPVSWEKVCDYCPRRIVVDCHALLETGLLPRCVEQDRDELHWLMGKQ